MVERRREAGACGNYCAQCRDFRVLADHDDALRRELASALTEEVGRTVLPEEVGCEGCWGTIHSSLVASLDCRIRLCVDAKGFATCAECSDFPCAIYLKQFPRDSHYVKNIRDIQKVGLEAWIAQNRGRDANEQS